VVFTDANQGEAYPDTLVGTDSHTTMVNGLGVLAGAAKASRPVGGRETLSGLRDRCVRVSHIGCATGGISPKVFSGFPSTRMWPRSCGSVPYRDALWLPRSHRRSPRHGWVRRGMWREDAR
jgi:hypothetical protein